MVGARRVLEVGTLGGYSGIWLARALPSDGRLVTIEGDEGRAAVARTAFERAGVADRVDLRVGEALDTLATLDGPFDAVFLDADKAPLPAYLDETLRLLRVGGLLLCDNTFMDGRIADPDADGADLRGMREFNERVANDPRFVTAVIPVRDGLLAALRVAA
jgi:predicted O-methyltransferase YrrM